MKNVSRRAFAGAMGALGLGAASAFSLAACSGDGTSSGSAASAQVASGDSAASTSAPSADAANGESAQAAFTVGTLATEDILPFWVAQEKGLFAQAGLDVQVVTFQSATELIAGVGSGAVDLAMTDIMVAASMFAGGTSIRMQWVTLGTTPAQGRFGIMVNEGSDVRELADLAGVPIGVGSNTILEYVMDKLMEQAGVPADQVVVEELQKLPVRYQAMASGEVAAAALPGSLLALGEASGCRTVADDTQGENLSQSVMVVRSEVLEDASRSAYLEALEGVWDDAVSLVNEDPDSFREVLVENANLSEAVAQTYPVSEYPYCELPTAAMVDPVLAWMDGKGYLTAALAYDEATGEFAVK